MVAVEITKNALCPICDQSLLSDASLKNFCTLCGMAKPEKDLIFEESQGNYFCCFECLDNHQAV